MDDLDKLLQNQLPIEELSYEQAMEQLEKIVEILESNELSLDLSIKLFERGQQLANHCTNLLDNTELKIKQIIDNQIVDFENPNEIEDA